MAADEMMEQADVHVLGTNTVASMATQHDLDVIYKDLSGYPTVSATYNGGVAAIGDQAFVLAVNPDTTPILLARYGKGKVVVAGDDSYFKFTSDITDERKTVARNILLWLTEDSETLTYQEALKARDDCPCCRQRGRIMPSKPMCRSIWSGWSNSRLSIWIRPLPRSLC